MTKRPNFVMFITDQQRADYLGCYGHPILKTPNIDRIAEQGTSFDKFYVASPVCMPNRASLMTGRMPSVHGVRCNGIPLSRQATTFVDLLRDAGYRTALVGKSHLQNFSRNPPLTAKPEPRSGFHVPSARNLDAFWHDTSAPDYAQESPSFWKDPRAEVATPFYGFDLVELVTGHGDNVGGSYRQWLRERDPDALELLQPDNELPHDYVCPQARRTPIPENLYSTAFVADRSTAYLDALDDGADDRPFFLMVSFPDPHHPFNPPGRYWDMYQPDQFPVPDAYLRNDWQPPPHVSAALAQREAGTANLSGMGSIAISAREAQEAQALTCGMIACIDDAIGGVLDALDARGDRENTVVLFTTDHGDHLGDHRLLLKGAEQYQSIIHVPFIWSDPTLSSGPQRTSAIGSSIDLSATILERAMIEPFNGMQGRSMLPVLDGRETEHREAAFIQYEHQRIAAGLGRPPRVHSLIAQDWRISVFEGASWGELYDLTNDPGEFDNLWDAPTAMAKKAKLMELLVRAEIEHMDRVPVPTALA